MRHGDRQAEREWPLSPTQDNRRFGSRDGKAVQDWKETV